MKKEVIQKAIKEVEKLLKVSARHSEDAACGYDEGWYNGEVNAYSNVLEILKRTINE